MRLQPQPADIQGMELLLAGAGTIGGFGAGWLAGTRQHLLYRQPEYRGAAATGRRALVIRSGLGLACALVAAVALRPGHYAIGPGLLTAAFGAVQGQLIRGFDLPPFLVTLGGVFVISTLIGVLTSAVEARLEDGRAVPNFMSQALKGKPITVYGDGSQTRSLCYVSDLVDGIYKLLLSGENGPVNIGNPHEITLLELAETIAVKALGLLTTKLPDGSKGYSLVILVTAEGFAPIPVGLGFTLTGIGGLVALHRTVRTDVLREGLKTGTLNSVLFPLDPLRNAPQLFSDLRRVFPPTAGRHVVGPMVQLRWGTPTLLTLDLALLVELPAPIRVVVLGRLQVLLPNQTHPLIQIRMDALGLLDVSAETVSLDATLYDSRILQFTLTGDMALRAGWGRQPQFVLAIGGFHPLRAAA